ncbi:MAG: hypothetical protein A2Y29_08925 [Spirochaetes bacterium GWE2_31_10]|nr:MAG: hypothetical protein A2Y29_08925 [Spirochaetes bacterium GWE2_31_10]
MKSKIFLISILALILVSCGVKMDPRIVKKLYVNSWELTNEKKMNYLSDNTVKWTASKIKDKELKKDYYLVEASWKKMPWHSGDVVIQYLVRKKDSRAILYGGIIDNTNYDYEGILFQIQAMHGLKRYYEATID